MIPKVTKHGFCCFLADSSRLRFPSCVRLPFFWVFPANKLPEFSSPVQVAVFATSDGRGCCNLGEELNASLAI